MDRSRDLTLPEIASYIRNELVSIEQDGHWRIRCGVLMPDHIHLFVVLGESLPLGRVVARFKARTRHLIATINAEWQGNFYEHRMRPDDRSEDVVRYMFLNPFRANLIPSTEIWPWFWLGADDTRHFGEIVDDGKPAPEWLA